MDGACNEKRSAERLAAESLAAEIARIGVLGVDDLRALWLAKERKPAPKALSADMLARMIAHKIQEQRLGKLDVRLRKLLDRLAQNGGEPVRHLKIGTVLVREHGGVLHEAMVVPGGFSHQGHFYPSLSKAAYAITGSVWNGPRFFGLRDKAQRSASEPTGLERDPGPPAATLRSSVRAKPQRTAMRPDSLLVGENRS
jgi:hypothetical protein